MPILTKPTFGPRTALIYITVGALIDVWVLVWYFTRGYPLTPTQRFWILGLGLTGLTFLVLGVLIGQIGRAARKAELPPEPETRMEADIQKTAAATGALQAQQVAAAPVAPPAPAAPPVAPVPAVTQAPPAGVQPRTA
jgi:hypothetical protein